MIIPALLLLILGVVVIYTSDQTLAIQQAIYGIAGMGCFLILKNWDYRSLKTMIRPLYIGIIALIIITFLIGFETRGSTRWIPLGLFNLQPSEFAKIVLILALAAFWSKRTPSWKNIGKAFLIVLPIAGLVFRQPDLGTALTIMFIWGLILLNANLPLTKILVMVVVSIISVPVVWLNLQLYQKQRVFSFLSPTSDPQGVGFHVIQSMIAVGSGGLYGRGLGRGTQSRLQFLPEFRTDFIFAFIAEELGFIGSLIVLVLYGLMFYIFFKIIANVGDKFGELIIVGVMAMILFQTTVNIAMNIGLLPITGITLPLLSYGGSSIITTFIGLGLVASVQKYGLKKKDMKIFEL